MRWTIKVLAIALIMASATSVPTAQAGKTKPACPSFNAFIIEAARDYSGTRKVPRHEIRKLRRIERCASAGGKAIDSVNWRIDRHAWLRRRHEAAQIAEYEPYTGVVGGDGWPVYRGHFAVPTCIVTAESHGLLHEHSHPYGSSGEYQIEPGTWASNGGTKYAPLPYEASHLQQSIVASRIWDHGRGASNWTTAARCGYSGR